MDIICFCRCTVLVNPHLCHLISTKPNHRASASHGTEIHQPQLTPLDTVVLQGMVTAPMTQLTPVMKTPLCGTAREPNTSISSKWKGLMHPGVSPPCSSTPCGTDTDHHQCFSHPPRRRQTTSGALCCRSSL